MWNYVELNVGIVAGSLPALKPLFVKLLREVKERTGASGSASKMAGYGGSKGYHKQGSSGRGGSGLELGNIKLKKGRSGDTGLWSQSRGNESDESVLPLHENQNRLDMLKGKKDSIIVTRSYEVT